MYGAKRNGDCIAVEVKSFVKPSPVQEVLIRDGKIWIHSEGTEDGVAYDSESASIPKSDIELAFHSESVRPHTGYAVA